MSDNQEKLIDVFQKVEYTGLERPEYILKNGRAFNIYAAYDYILEQQDKIDQQAARIAELESVAQRVVGALSCSGYGAVENSLNPVESLLFDAEEALSNTTPGTQGDK